jgi:hypothetical protein
MISCSSVCTSLTIWHWQTLANHHHNLVHKTLRTRTFLLVFLQHQTNSKTKHTPTSALTHHKEKHPHLNSRCRLRLQSPRPLFLPAATALALSTTTLVIILPLHVSSFSTALASILYSLTSTPCLLFLILRNHSPRARREETTLKTPCTPSTPCVSRSSVTKMETRLV